jgi:hypothetical protein
LDAQVDGFDEGGHSASPVVEDLRQRRGVDRLGLLLLVV